MAHAVAGSHNNPDTDELIAGRIARLSQGQLDCLRLVDQHYASSADHSALQLGDFGERRFDAKFVPGLRTVGFGDGSECPPQQASADLRIVA